MANYIISKTDGTSTITIPNATEYTDLSISLLGQNYVGFGQIVAQNQLSVLENFYNTTPPAKAVRGQLWVDSTTKLLKVWTGEDPTDPLYNAITDDSAVAVSMWKVVGPAGIDGLNIGTNVDPFDNLYVDNIFAQNGEFETLFVGISSTGCTLSNTGILPSPNSTNSATGLSLGGTANKFKEAHVRNNLIYGDLRIGADSFAGSNQVILKADSSINYTLIPDASQQVNLGSATASNKRFNSVNVLTIDGKTLVLGSGASEGVASHLIPTVDNSYDIGSTLYYYNQAYINEVVALNVNPKDSTATVGSSLNKFDQMFANTFNGRATNAEYADLAERYEADQPYESGTVVKIGGTKEITQTTWESDQDVFGVISTLPGLCLNSNAGTDDTHPYVALSGRVPVKVIGKVIKGQRLVSSNIPGVAKAASGHEHYSCIIGRALETKHTEDCQKILIVVGVK